MADLGTVGVRTTAVLTGNAQVTVTLLGGIQPAPTPYPDLQTWFENQSKPDLTNYPLSRVYLGL